MRQKTSAKSAKRKKKPRTTAKLHKKKAPLKAYQNGTFPGFAKPIPSEAELIPSDPCTTAEDLSTYLKKYKGKTGVKVHPNPVSFSSAKDKANWRGALRDIDNRDTFQDWWAGREREVDKPFLALFSVPPEWRSLGRPRKQQYIVIVWDCDPRSYRNPDIKAERQLQDNDRWKPILQRGFFDTIRRDFAFTARFYYSIDASQSGQNRCLPISMERILWLALLKTQNFQGDSDPRLKDCVLLRP
ncbi:hypothetical protein GGTG_13344 [Gaeumannomyces tritici R3-111a-1]|uniref:Uncharacterized protein n=1 Tax=Gaeumannomyces tritici (strain R3-111a-1) TaxID=644352 RepID=J3PIL5_GAET3|nr:hypothetical protein GGTG_13344 [Gaeumannomyces tritici R3-111a-1]EJT69076.1 hypothetical protein GGTG_13344 [Gaeumannomyces tritici R3-111a-1]